MHANISVFVPHNGCPHKCSFCDQREITGQHSQPTPDDVSAAIERAAQKHDPYADMQLAFFGGSFTAIDRDYMISLLSAAQPYIRSGFLSGIRCSTRPDCIDDEILSILTEYGVKAIELGAQSMVDRVLMLNRRGHTAEQVRCAARLIKQSGIELGLQMMTGLYGDDDNGARYTAGEMIRLMPSTVRIYPTVVLKNTELERLYHNGEYSPPDTERSVPLCAELIELFRKSGIRVIRVGLHAERSIEQNLVAGAYHPAMGELCESYTMYRNILESLRAQSRESVTIAVNPRDVSKALGQRRANIARLRNDGYSVTVVQSENCPKGRFSIIDG